MNFNWIPPWQRTLYSAYESLSFPIQSRRFRLFLFFTLTAAYSTIWENFKFSSKNVIDVQSRQKHFVFQSIQASHRLCVDFRSLSVQRSCQLQNDSWTFFSFFLLCTIEDTQVVGVYRTFCTSAQGFRGAFRYFKSDTKFNILTTIRKLLNCLKRFTIACSWLLCSRSLCEHYIRI